ncbi:RNA 2',3'-cyclic phosphodiesterase [Alicyclobacillus sp.]|uniref:RNA 2',3'-cyclic phosphodiesterase n=1 Tax=Alicyclobacillus sp. TaxID=61169 RepID=UPI0025B8A9C4|nr:RNA 2',3'-cyclic phosphodiesterase [Alicyclobacillus sp.]MCL6515446.1 RNA 2',3'-cyclic phosphodiesterase [Alicyclobacillus sp.]
MPRLFFGIEVANEIRDRLAEVCRDLRTLGVRAGNWSSPDLYHITSLFLGQVDDRVLPELERVGQRAAASVAPPRLTLEGIGTFLRNRVLWAGVREDEGLDALATLHRTLSQSLAGRPWVKLEDRPYRAHLTLARQLDVTAWTALEPRAAAMTRPAIAGLSWVPQALCLFESTRAGGRLVYPVRMRFPFTPGDGAARSE